MARNIKVSDRSTLVHFQMHQASVSKSCYPVLYIFGCALECRASSGESMSPEVATKKRSGQVEHRNILES